MSVPDDLIAYFTKERATLWQQAEMLHLGKLQIAERSVDHPEWKDTTKASLERVLRQLGEIDALLARYAQKSQ
jgi:hypothetical protein